MIIQTSEENANFQMPCYTLTMDDIFGFKSSIISPEIRRRLRDACDDHDKTFTAEIVKLLLDALDEAYQEIASLEDRYADACSRLG